MEIIDIYGTYKTIDQIMAKHGFTTDAHSMWNEAKRNIRQKKKLIGHYTEWEVPFTYYLDVQSYEGAVRIYDSSQIENIKKACEEVTHLGFKLQVFIVGNAPQIRDDRPSWEE